MIDFIDFVTMLEDYGWEYCIFQDVYVKNKHGTRYTLIKKLSNACSYESLIKKLKANIGDNNIITGTATHKYAPEIIYNTIIILDND